MIKTGILQNGDGVLVEPFLESNGSRTDASGFKWRSVNPFLNFIQSTGIDLDVYGVATYNPEQRGSAKEVMEVVIPKAIEQRFKYFAITNPQYGAFGPGDSKDFVPILPPGESGN